MAHPLFVLLFVAWAFVAYGISTYRLRSAKRELTYEHPLNIALGLNSKPLMAAMHQMLTPGKWKITAQEVNGENLIESIKQTPYIDILLLHANMPVYSGIEITKWVKEYRPEISILVVYLYHQTSIVEEMMAAGAEGNFILTHDREELRTAVKKIVTKGYYRSPVLPVDRAPFDEAEARRILQHAELI